MTTETIISGMAGRYATALFALAKEQGVADQVSTDLKNFKAMVTSSSDLTALVRSPVISVDDQARALTSVLASANITGVASNFIQLVTSKRRLFAISDMIAGYQKLLDTDNGVIHAEVTSAQPLDAAQSQALASALSQVSGGKTVDVNAKVDPSIIGGLVVKLGSRMLDASLKTKLNSIRSLMKEVG